MTVLPGSRALGGETATDYNAVNTCCLYSTRSGRESTNLWSLLEGTAGSPEMHFGGSYRRVRGDAVEVSYLLHKVLEMCDRVLLLSRAFGHKTGAFSLGR